MSKISASSPAVSGGACPRCKMPLIDPGGLGWCKSCGYCKSLADTEKKTQPDEAKSPAAMNSLTATGAALRQSPTWAWVTLAGIVLVAGATLVLGRFLTLSPLERALLTTVQTGVAFAFILVGQFIGVMKVAPEDPTLGFWDALFPFRLYGLILKRLPATRLTLYLGVWGLAAVITANVFIGGLGHWLTYLPDSKKQPNQVQKTKAAKT